MNDTMQEMVQGIASSLMRFDHHPFAKALVQRVAGPRCGTDTHLLGCLHATGDAFCAYIHRPPLSSKITINQPAGHMLI